MAWWDDVIRNIFGGGQQQTAKPSPSPTSRRQWRDEPRQDRPQSFQPVAPSRQQTAVQTTVRPQQQTSLWGTPVSQPMASDGRGGGGGGARGMSRSTTPTFTAASESDNHLDEMSVWDKFIYGQNREAQAHWAEDQTKPKPKYTFWDDLGAWFTSPVENNIFMTPIAGAAQKKEDERNLWNEVMGEGNLNPDGTFKVPTNTQLQQLGSDTLYNDGHGNLIPVRPWGGQSTQQLQDDAKTERDLYLESFTAPATTTSRQLTNEEWAALTPDQQRGVIANYTLYQAVQADKALKQNMADQKPEDVAAYMDSIESIFGADGGSDTYAPNTIQALRELGYQNQEVGDLDLFLGGQAISSYDDIVGNKGGARGDVFTQLAGSDAFTQEPLVAALDRGASLLDALKQAPVFSPDVQTFSGVQSALSRIPEDRISGLQDVLAGMADQGVYDTISQDAAKNREFSQILNEATRDLDPILVADFFKEQYGNLQGAMPFQQFEHYWLKNRS